MALNARQAAFVRHYAAGADGVRGNASASYAAAGYSARGHVAEVNANRLLRNAAVKAAVKRAHAAAEKAATQTLADWKDLAVDAQRRVVTIAHGRLPDPETAAPGIAIVDRETSAVGKLLLDANLEIIERGYPKKLQVEHSGEIKGGVLAVPIPVAQQDWDAMAKAQQEKLGHVTAG